VIIGSTVFIRKAEYDVNPVTHAQRLAVNVTGPAALAPQLDWSKREGEELIKPMIHAIRDHCLFDDWS
jgi:hypothetical protein